MVTNLVTRLEEQSNSFWAIFSLILIAGIGGVDYLTGYELAFSLFYLFPIFLVTWFSGKRLGFAASVISALVWLTADLASGHPYSHPAIYYWNTLIRLTFFIIGTILLSALKKVHEHEKELARVDPLTEAANSRFFYELLQIEIYRLRRYGHPFTVAYIDVDDFKTINDSFGHSVGNKVLHTIVKYSKNNLRKTDIIARLGGDEFAFLLPETDQTGAHGTLSKIQSGLLEEMVRNEWPVTFSIGVLTCLRTPQTIDELMKQADDLMYSVKNNGKNGIRYSQFTS